MLTIFTNPPIPKATTLKIIEKIAMITVIIHAQPFPLNKPHANRKHAIPIAMPIAPTTIAIVAIVLVIVATSSGDLHLFIIAQVTKVNTKIAKI